MAYFSYDPNLLAELARAPSKRAAGLEAFTQGFTPGLNQAVSSGADIVRARKQKADAMKLLSQLYPQMAQSQGQPPTAGIGGTMSGQQNQPFNGIDPSKLLGVYMKVDPQGAQQLIGKMIQQQMGGSALNPLQQAQADYYKAKTSSLQGGGGPPGPAAYVNEAGDVSATPKEGYQPVSKALLPYVGVSASTKEKNKALSSRAEAWQRSIDTRQIDTLISRTGLTQKQQSVVQMNNLRSARALSILNQPQITWQELALGEIDLTGIMQGGVPMRDEIVATHFPGWQENVARWKTYATGHPTENVPPDIKNKVKSLVSGVVQIDNTILKANAKFAKSMLGPTIRGGLTPQQGKSIDEMTSVLSTEGPGQGKLEDPLGIR